MENQEQKISVVVTDIDISFTQAVNLILKFSIASIPALIILVFCGAACGAILGLIAAMFGMGK